MARVSKKPLSRRRSAAIRFLSNISLGDFEENTEDSDRHLTLIDEINQTVARINVNNDDAVFEENGVFNSKYYADHEFTKILQNTSFRNRINTENFERKTSDLKQSKYALVEDLIPSICFSSSESITSGLRKTDHSSSTMKLKEIKIRSVSDLHNYKDERGELITPKTPFYTNMLSCLPYKKTKKKTDSKKENPGRRRNLSGSRPMSSIIDNLDPFLLLGLEKNSGEQLISYQQLLLPSSSSCCDQKKNALQNANTIELYLNKNYHFRCISIDLGIPAKLNSILSLSTPFLESRNNDWKELIFDKNSQLNYSPFLLDDPDFTFEKYRSVQTFQPCKISVLPHVRPAELKKELNEKFKEKFPHIQLTLTKLRSIKREMKKISKTEDCIDLLTVAQAYVYFEKLILKNVINKTNRKLCAAACLILSAKMNDIKGSALKLLLEKLESTFRLNKKDLLALEFPVLVALEFNLHIPTWEVLPHFKRLMHESNN